MKYSRFSQAAPPEYWGIQACITSLLTLYIAFISGKVFAGEQWLIVDSPDVTFNTFSMAYYIDHSGHMKPEEVVKKLFVSSGNALTLGADAKTTWVKIKLQNPTAQNIPLYLHYPFAFHNLTLDLYESADGRLRHTHHLDTDDQNTLKSMYRGLAVFDIQLPAHSERIIYVKSRTYIHQWFTIKLYGTEQSKRALQNNNADINLLIGMMLALMIYNLFMFISSRQKEHYYYAMYLLFGGIWLALTYGLIAELFQVYGILSRYLNLALGGMPIFLLLFMMEIFSTRQNYPREHSALRIMQILLCLNMAYGLVNMSHAIDLSTYLAGLMMIVSLTVSLSLLRKRHVLAKYFLFGHGLFIVFGLLAVLFYEGIVEYSYLNSHSLGVGILLEAIILALIISHRLRVLENLQHAQHELKHLASTDPLTQLLNRRQFEVESRLSLEKAIRNQKPLTVIMIDIDRFKAVNDTYGHAVGDQLIIYTASVLKEYLTNGETISRYGGEEFVILMPDTSVQAAWDKIEYLREQFALWPAVTDSGMEVDFTVSAGIAPVQWKENGVNEAIHQADEALYFAKNNGRNQVCVFEEIDGKKPDKAREMRA